MSGDRQDSNHIQNPLQQLLKDHSLGPRLYAAAGVATGVVALALLPLNALGRIAGRAGLGPINDAISSLTGRPMLLALELADRYEHVAAQAEGQVAPHRWRNGYESFRKECAGMGFELPDFNFRALEEEAKKISQAWPSVETSAIIDVTPVVLSDVALEEKTALTYPQTVDKVAESETVMQDMILTATTDSQEATTAQQEAQHIQAAPDMKKAKIKTRVEPKAPAREQAQKIARVASHLKPKAANRPVLAAQPRQEPKAAVLVKAVKTPPPITARALVKKPAAKVLAKVKPEKAKVKPAKAVVKKPAARKTPQARKAPVLKRPAAVKKNAAAVKKSSALRKAPILPKGHQALPPAKLEAREILLPPNHAMVLKPQRPVVRVKPLQPPQPDQLQLLARATALTAKAGYTILAEQANELYTLGASAANAVSRQVTKRLEALIHMQEERLEARRRKQLEARAALAEVVTPEPPRIAASYNRVSNDNRVKEPKQISYAGYQQGTTVDV